MYIFFSNIFTLLHMVMMQDDICIYVFSINSKLSFFEWHTNCGCEVNKLGRFLAAH